MFLYCGAIFIQNRIKMRFGTDFTRIVMKNRQNKVKPLDLSDLGMRPLFEHLQLDHPQVHGCTYHTKYTNPELNALLHANQGDDPLMLNVTANTEGIFSKRF